MTRLLDDRDTGTSKSKADYLADFSGRGGDRIDLKLIDANRNKSGDQKFSFIGTKAFTEAQLLSEITLTTPGWLTWYTKNDQYSKQKLTADLETQHDLVEGLCEMGERCEEMVKVALDSFAQRDVERARALVDLDELVDRTNRRVTDKVLEMAASPGLQEWGMRMIVVARCLERIGDNAVDIGEQTAFVVTGEFHEFGDASH